MKNGKKKLFDFVLVVIFVVLKGYIISKKEIKGYINEFAIIFKMINIAVDFIAIVISFSPKKIYDFTWLFFNLYTLNNIINSLYSILEYVLRACKR